MPSRGTGVRGVPSERLKNKEKMVRLDRWGKGRNVMQILWA
jgi:hypothetical protein